MTLITCIAPKQCQTPDLCANLAECRWPDDDEQGPRTVMVPVSAELLARLSNDWSEPVQLRVETNADGKRSFVLRTVAA